MTEVYLYLYMNNRDKGSRDLDKVGIGRLGALSLRELCMLYDVMNLIIINTKGSKNIFVTTDL